MTIQVGRFGVGHVSRLNLRSMKQKRKVSSLLESILI